MFTTDEAKGAYPIAIVRGGSSDGEIVYVRDKPTSGPGIKNKPTSKVSVVDGQFEQVPSEKTRVVYIAGSSGSGKSTYASNYIENWLGMNPKAKFYLFSKLEDDKVLDRLKPIRIAIDDSIVENPLEIEEVEKGSIVCFDDCDNLSNKNVQKAVNKFKEKCLELGRHRNIQVINTSHLISPNEKSMGRIILNEAQCFIFFPQSGSVYQIKYTLKTQFGLSQNQIKAILDKNDSRWICITKIYPQVILTQTTIMFVKDL